MMRINLSDEKGKTPTSDIFENLVSDDPGPKKSGKQSRPPRDSRFLPKALILVLLLGVTGYIGFDKRDILLERFESLKVSAIGIISSFGKPETPPPPPAEVPVRPAQPSKPPVYIFDTLDRIIDGIPERVRITHLTVRDNSVYEIKGVAETQDIVDSLGVFFEANGSVASRMVLSREGSHYFSFSGALPDTIQVQTGLLASEKLISIGETLLKAATGSVAFTGLPLRGKIYTPEVLPFTFEGGYANLKNILEELAPRGSELLVHRLVIFPSGGEDLEKVKAHFSIRTASIQ